MNKFVFLPAVMMLATAGCQSDPPPQKRTGSYTAARHSQTGSNIPQPTNASTVGETYDPNQFQNVQNQQTSAAGRSLSGAAGGR